MRLLNCLLILLISSFICGVHVIAQAEPVRANPVVADAFGDQGAGGMQIYENNKKRKNYPIHHNRDRGDYQDRYNHDRYPYHRYSYDRYDRSDRYDRR